MCVCVANSSGIFHAYSSHVSIHEEENIMWKEDIILLFYIVYLNLFCRRSYISGSSPACSSPILYAMFTLSPCLHFLTEYCQDNPR